MYGGLIYVYVCYLVIRGLFLYCKRSVRRRWFGGSVGVDCSECFEIWVGVVFCRGGVRDFIID